MESVVVKVFGSEEVEKASGGGEVAILADLAAPNPVKLDTLLQAVYGAVLTAVEGGGGAFSQVYLYIELPNDKLYFIKGKVVDALYGLNTIILNEKVKALYNCNSWNHFIAPVTEELYGVFKDSEEHYTAFGKRLTKILRKEALRKIRHRSLYFQRHPSLNITTSQSL